LVQNFGARQRPSIRYADFRERRFPDVRLGPRRAAKIDPKRLRPGGDELKALPLPNSPAATMSAEYEFAVEGLTERGAFPLGRGHGLPCHTVSGDQEGMAFIPTLNTQHPKIWPLFKWVALIFLAPLMVLAVIPILITTIAQFPVLGQVNFAFLGGTLASLPVVIRRQRRTPKEQAFRG
jgi:hypothetical protein